jgi:putative peptidoglycan lipid II flippase
MKLNKSGKVGVLILFLLGAGKIVALLRDMLFSMYFGTSIQADAYFSANILPNLINMTFVMSALIFFIPVYSKVVIEKGDEEARKFTSNLMNIFVSINIVLSLISFLLAPYLIKIIAPGLSGAVYEISVELSRLMVLSFPITSIVHVLINVSNANHRHLFPQTITVLNGIITIVLMIIYVPKYGVYCVPIIGLFAWFIQVFIQGYLIRDIYKYKMYFNLKDENAKKIIRLAIPVIIATAAVQINLAIDTMWGSILGTGSISVINYAQKIFNLLNGTIVLTIITLSYPILSKMFGLMEYDKFLASIKKYLKIILYVMIPVVIISLVSSEEIVKLIYLRGNFNLDNAKLVSDVFKIYLLSVIFVGIKEFYTRIFYIIGDSITPTRISVIGILLNIILNSVFVRILGVYGIALSTLISSYFMFSLNHKFLTRKIKNSTGIIMRNYNKPELIKLVLCILIIFLVSNSISSVFVSYNSMVRLILVSITVFVMYLGFLLITKNEVLQFVFTDNQNNKIEKE